MRSLLSQEGQKTNRTAWPQTYNFKPLYYEIATAPLAGDGAAKYVAARTEEL